MIVQTREPEEIVRERRLAELVAARMCHDLVSPIGAVVNGMELVSLLGRAEADEDLNLVGASGNRAAAMLRLYRTAFGPEASEPVPMSDLARRLSGLYPSLDVRADMGRTLSPSTARLVALMTIVTARSGGRQPRLSLAIGSEDALALAQGPNAGFAEGTRRALDSGDTAEARHVDAAMLVRRCRPDGRRLRVEVNPGSAGLRLEKG